MATLPAWGTVTALAVAVSAVGASATKAPVKVQRTVLAREAARPFHHFSSVYYHCMLPRWNFHVSRWASHSRYHSIHKNRLNTSTLALLSVLHHRSHHQQQADVGSPELRLEDTLLERSSLTFDRLNCKLERGKQGKLQTHLAPAVLDGAIC